MSTVTKFRGEHGSPKHKAHIARIALEQETLEVIDALCTLGDPAASIEDRANAARDLEASKDLYPVAYAEGCETYERKAAEVNLMAGATRARKPCAILGTEELTHIDRFKRGYVVKGLIGRGRYVEIYGAPGAGKTFVALDIAYAVAQGRAWMGCKVNAGLVLYIPYEGGGGLTKRVAALVDKYGHAPRFQTVDHPTFDLRNKTGRQELGAAIAQLPEKPALIIFDTLAHALCGGDENSAQDIGAFNSAVAALIESTGAAVLILHHPGKDPKKGARGSSALLGALDAEIEIHDKTITSRKQRDGENPAPIGFTLEAVALCEDEDGDPITSCTVAPSAAGSRNAYKPTGQAREAFNALSKLSPNNEPVTFVAWRDAFVRESYRGELPSENTQRVAFNRNVKKLANAGMVVESDKGWQRAMTGGADA